MRDLGLPILAIKASYKGPTVKSTSIKKGVNFYIKLPLCIKAYIILVKNL
jgi:hypothetical protein